MIALLALVAALLLLAGWATERPRAFGLCLGAGLVVGLVSRLLVGCGGIVADSPPDAATAEPAQPSRVVPVLRIDAGDEPQPFAVPDVEPERCPPVCGLHVRPGEKPQ